MSAINQPNSNPKSDNRTLMEANKDLMVLFCCTPLTGHLLPNLQIAQYLVKRGYDVSFLGSTLNKLAIERTGAKFLPHIGLQNYASENLVELFPDHADMTDGLEGFAWYAENIWANAMPSASESVKNALVTMRRHAPEKKIVIICETWFTGLLPFKLGADLPEGFTELPKSLGTSILPATFASVDTGPMGTALPFDSSESGRARNIMLADLLAKSSPFKEVTAYRDKMLRACGAKRDVSTLFNGHDKVITPGIFDPTWVCHDTILQMCIPSLDYPYSDWPPYAKFGGTLPIKLRDPDFKPPSWFNQITSNSATLGNSPGSRAKKVVMVTQGTVAINYSQLIIPTLTGLAERNDLIVVALLGARGSSLEGWDDKGTAMNAIVVDYFPYDEILPHIDVLITNASYGVFQHSVVNGVPSVMAGSSEDKPEVALRAERAGLAINLRTGTPTPEAVAAAVDKILASSKYKLRAEELKREAAEFDALGTVEREMLALIAQ